VSVGAEGTIASAGDDGAVWVWAGGRGEQRVLRGHQASTSAVVLAADGKSLVSGGYYDGKVRRWTLGSPGS
jgi:WD40 repeat protein